MKLNFRQKQSLSVIFTIFILLSCTYSVKVHYFTSPKSRLDVSVHGDTVMMRSMFADVIVQPVDSKSKFSHIKSSGIYNSSSERLTDKLLSQYNPEYPHFHFYMIIIRNRTDFPIREVNSYIKYSDRVFEELDKESIKDTSVPEQFLDLDLSKTFEYRRLLSSNTNVLDVDFAKETIRFDSKSILPGDAVVFFRAYMVRPVELSEFKLFVEIIADELNHVINFDFEQLRFREDSKDFERYKNQIEESRDKGRRMIWI